MSIPQPNESPAVSAGASRRLRIGYYLDNFELLLAETARRYGDLLSEGELRFAARFAELRSQLDALALPAGPATAGAGTQTEHSAYTQFGRCATELGAMLLAAQPAFDSSRAPFPATTSHPTS